MKTQTGILIIALILILILGIYILNDKIIRPIYQQQGINAVIININQRGEIPILNNETINWIPIQQICNQREQQ